MAGAALRFLLLLLGVALPGWAAAGGPVLFYRYLDDHGGVVVNRSGVPPQYIGRGYEVLNEQAVVVQTVPPAPSAEEFRQQQARKQQQLQDRQLLLLYSSVADVDQARTRKLAEIDSLIAVARASQTSVAALQSRLQQQAGDSQRAGADVPDYIRERLAQLDQEQARLAQGIERYRQLRQSAEQSYAADRARLLVLQGPASTSQ